jgi:hypothetical protein
VVPRFNTDHGDTLRTLDFQKSDIEDNVRRSTCIRPILKEEIEAMARNDDDVKFSPDQVSQLAFLVL